MHLDLCICDQAELLCTSTRIDLVVHHRELKRTTNTGRLGGLVLENFKIWERGRQGRPFAAQEVLDPQHQSLLLYPSEDALEISEDLVQQLRDERPFQIVVPDGNWRQASKVHYREKAFKSLPRIKLPEQLNGEELFLRKESKPGGLSTLEAIGHVLRFFEGPDVGEHVLRFYRLKRNATLKSRGHKGSLS